MAEVMPHQPDSSELVPAPATGVQPNQWLWIAWQRWPRILLGVALGLAVGACIYFPSRPVYRSTAQPANDSSLPAVLLWQPALFAADGTARLEFELPRQPATYHVIVHGHTASGRVGSVQAPIVSRP